MATAIGVISGLITIFSFAEDQLPQQESPKNKFTFYLGNDGAMPPGGGGALSNAGGEKPDVRVWSEEIDFLGITTNDGNTCVDGSIVCETSVDNVQREPTYALFSANNDAICVSWIGSTFPNGYKYGHLTGNWAQTCADNYGKPTSWYYSDVYVKRKDNGANQNVMCGWMDGDGDQPTTGLQIHWPDFDTQRNPQGSNDAAYWCNDNRKLNYHTDSDPNYVVYKKSRRDMFSSEPTYATSPAEDASQVKARRANDVQKRSLIDRLSQKLVKSQIKDQTASFVCGSENSAGASFVSMVERQFCHMSTKTVYPFCEDVAAGLCWNDELNIVTPKLVSLLAPELNFTDLVFWEDKSDE